MKAIRSLSGSLSTLLGDSCFVSSGGNEGCSECNGAASLGCEEMDSFKCDDKDLIFCCEAGWRANRTQMTRMAENIRSRICLRLRLLRNGVDMSNKSREVVGQRSEAA